MTVERGEAGDMTPGEEREQPAWEEALNYPSAEPVSGPIHKCIENTGGGRGERWGQGIKRVPRDPFQDPRTQLRDLWTTLPAVMAAGRQPETPSPPGLLCTRGQYGSPLGGWGTNPGLWGF